MRRILRVLTAISLCVAVPITASASPHLSPPGTNFQIKGLSVITVPSFSLNCDLTLVGHTSGAVALKSKAGSITAASTHTTGCLIQFRGLPWNIALTSKSGGYVQNVSYDIGGETCTPENIPFTVNKKGVWKINGSPNNCNLTGALKSTPEVTVVR
jgi:hypothetical protein